MYNGTVPIATRNVAARAQAYAAECRRRSAWYKHGLLLVPHGDDMKGQRGDWQRQNMTLIMDYIHGHPELGTHINGYRAGLLRSTATASALNSFEAGPTAALPVDAGASSVSRSTGPRSPRTPARSPRWTGLVPG